MGRVQRWPRHHTQLTPRLHSDKVSVLLFLPAAALAATRVHEESNTHVLVLRNCVPGAGNGVAPTEGSAVDREHSGGGGKGGGGGRKGRVLNVQTPLLVLRSAQGDALVEAWTRAAAVR